MQKVLPTQLYSTANMAPTESTYYADHHQYEFKATIVRPVCCLGNAGVRFSPLLCS